MVTMARYCDICGTRILCAADNHGGFIAPLGFKSLVDDEKFIDDTCESCGPELTRRVREAVGLYVDQVRKTYKQCGARMHVDAVHDDADCVRNLRQKLGT